VQAKQFRELEQILKLVSAPTNPNLSDRVASLKGLSSILSGASLALCSAAEC
jgi:hypothetical protein